MKRLFSTLLAVCIIALGASANKTVRGKVVSATDNEPLIGASVQAVGSNEGTATDINGEFTVTVNDNVKQLKISYVGYTTQVVAVASQVTVALVEEDNTLEEVVVTAMGITRKQKSLGYAAQQLKADDISGARTTDAMNSLNGKVAGLQVQATSSDPGAANSVIIRGFSSINGSNQPLYVVDGVPLQSTTLTGQGHAQTAGGISSISPNDIESLTVLKGAAATALYGSRAANGVIIVTTKQGKKGEGKNFTIEYNGSVQARQVALLPKMQNNWGQGWNGTQTYIENGSWGPRLDGSTQVYGPIWNHSQLVHKYDAKENNVKDFFDLGWSHNHSIAFSGVSNDNKVNYYLSYNYAGDDGILPGKKDVYKRHTLDFRGGFEATEWLKLTSAISYAKSQTDLVGSFQGTSVIDGILEFPRDISVVDLKDLSSPFHTPEAYFTPYGITNPYWAIENNYNHVDSKQMRGKIQADINPIKDLTLTYRFGFDYTDYDRKIGYPQIALDDALINEDYGYAPSNMNQDGWVYTAYGRRYELNHDFLADYTRNFMNERLSLAAIAGVNLNERYSTGMVGQTDGLTFETGFWDLSNGATRSTLTETQWKRRQVALFGDVTLGWDDMIFLNLTGRNEWSSTLPIGANSYFYPGATLSWIFTRLIPRNDILTYGKARLAYGKTGNDADPYLVDPRFVQAFASGYYSGTDIEFPFAGLNAFQAAATAGSKNLKPEMTTEFEAGLQLQFFNSRLGIDFTYYNRITKDQIFTLPVDPSTGYNNVVTNFGEVRNRGIELLVNTTPILTNNFRWDLGFNFAVNKNKVLSMPESLEGGKVTIYSFSAGDDAVYMYAEEGKPMGSYYTFLPETYTDAAGVVHPVVNAYGQPVLSSETLDTGRDMNHKWTGGVNTSISAYGVTLSAQLDVRYGGTMFSRTKNLMQFTGNAYVTDYNMRRPFIIPNSVVSDGDGGYVENTTPIIMSDQGLQDYWNKYGAGQGGEYYLVDRTFAKLRNLSLTWELPKKWVNAAKLSNVAITLFGNNLFTWTARDNYDVDPESTTTGTDLAGGFGELYSNPSCRTFGINLSIKY
ncbi:MAG: SusC/RagA family TonB-linked outer membrane protein [Muribaculaceae bacterium]|nr:SusC/RagA family TonB-linked outer membrane protein [Muribaculaceae bacterium]